MKHIAKTVITLGTRYRVARITRNGGKVASEGSSGYLPSQDIIFILKSKI